MALANYIVFLQISQVHMTSYMPFARVKYNPREHILRGSHWVLLDQTTTTFLRGDLRFIVLQCSLARSWFLQRLGYVLRSLLVLRKFPE